MSDDAIGYVYINVGHEALVGAPEAVGYVYLNVGTFGVASVLGRLVGLVIPDWISVGYVYVNVLDLVSGAGRTMEDGSGRHLEDGTTQRTLE